MGGVIDKETAAIFQQGYELVGQFLGDGGATESSSHDAVFVQDAFADIGCAMDDDVPFTGQAVEASVHSIDAEGKAVLAEIGAPGDVEAQAAFVGFGCVGKGVSELFAGADAMGDVVAVEELASAHVDDIHSLQAGGLAEVTDGEYIRIVQGVFFQQPVIADQCVFQDFFIQAGVCQLHFFKHYIGFHADEL